MGSRIKKNPDKILDCFCEIVAPNSSQELPWVLQKYPSSYTDDIILKSVPQFTFPCEFESNVVQFYSFVLTNANSQWTFGFCRHGPKSPTALVVLSSMPWHEFFYKVLCQLAEITMQKNASELESFLESLYTLEIPDPGITLSIMYNGGSREFLCQSPDIYKLPSIPENRNLAEYFNAVDVNNMMIIFASMLYERRIVVTSRKLSRLSACVQAANSLLSPMNWQHIFIPVLPLHLLDYLSAPMPFLIGVPEALMKKVSQDEIGEVVLLNADNNHIVSPFVDLDTLPSEVVANLKKKLKNPNNMLGEGVARSFLQALVQLIGGYRDALKFKQGEKITFCPQAFVESRPSNMQPFLEKMLHLQIFQQFIEERLDMLNSGQGFSDEFELEACLYSDKSSSRLKQQYKEWLGSLKKDGGALIKSVKQKANPAVKSAVRSVKETSKNVRAKGKSAYKDIRTKIRELHARDDFSPVKTTLSSRSIDKEDNNEDAQAHSAPVSPNVSQRIKRPVFLAGDVGPRPYRREVSLNPDEVSRSPPLLNVGRDGQPGSRIVSPDLTFQGINLDILSDLETYIRRSQIPSSDYNDETNRRNLKHCQSLNCITSSAPALPPPRSKKKLLTSLSDGCFSAPKPSLPKKNFCLETPDLIRLDSEELVDEQEFDPLVLSSRNKGSKLPPETTVITPHKPLYPHPYPRERGNARLNPVTPTQNPTVNSVKHPPHLSPTEDALLKEYGLDLNRLSLSSCNSRGGSKVQCLDGLASMEQTNIGEGPFSGLNNLNIDAYANNSKLKWTTFD